MNLIFQYMITNEETNKRGRVPQYPQGTRAELYRKTADLSAESFRIYADKIGAQHHYSTKQVFTAGHTGSTVLLFECLRMVYDTLYDEYDKVLFVDTDIICNTEENIFDVVEDGIDVTGVFESDIQTSKGGGYNTWDYNEEVYTQLKEKYKRNNIPIVPTKPPNRNSNVTTFNTGVLVWTKEARLKARECFDSWLDYMKDGEEHGDPFWLNNDQPFISGQLMKHGFKVKSIDQKWNDTPTHWSDDRGYNMNFLHYTGGGNKVVMLEDYENNKFKYLKKT
jgi:lipopolysaccharide biosynthesis glycosyltransferase